MKWHKYLIECLRGAREHDVPLEQVVVILKAKRPSFVLFALGKLYNTVSALMGGIPLSCFFNT